jgi:hypothetical protein
MEKVTMRACPNYPLNNTPTKSITIIFHNICNRRKTNQKDRISYKSPSAFEHIMYEIYKFSKNLVATSKF